MTPERVRIAAYSGLIVLAAALRVWSALSDGPLHPDEFFQYLEPAWWHLTGSGFQAWEWFDGLRSWVLPFYNGAWMALLMRLGVKHGATLGSCLRVHWALVNVLLVPLAYRAGARLSRKLVATTEGADALRAEHAGGFAAALLCACFPLLALYAGHTLSELPSMLCLTAGLVFCVELVDEGAERDLRRVALVGFVFSLGVCLRVANAPLALLPPVWFVAMRQWRPLAALAAGAAPPVLVFGLVDLFTWGSFASSYVEYLTFNVVEGRAEKFGTEPPQWYLVRLWQTLPRTMPLLAIVIFAGVRSSWPFVASALGMLLIMSTQAHKEGRFLIGLWPLLLIAAGGTLGAWFERCRVRPSSRPALRRVQSALPALLVVAVLLDGTHDLRRDYWVSRSRTECEVWAGSQPDLTGLLVDEVVMTSGYLWFGRKEPLVEYKRGLFENPLFSHALVKRGSKEEREARKLGFEPAFQRGKIVVLRRGAP